MYCRIINGVPQASLLTPFLFNICISDLPTTVSRKFAYADDLGIMHADGDWQAVEEVLTKDMATLGEYLHTSKLKLSTVKAVSATFHLNNKEAKRELKVNFNSETLLFCSEPKYLGVTLDSALTYCQHIESICKKLTSRGALLELGYLLQLGCWSNNSANRHPSPGAFNRRVLCACLVPQCSYPPHRPSHQRCLVNCDWMSASHTNENLPVLAGIQPANLRRN